MDRSSRPNETAANGSLVANEYDTPGWNCPEFDG